MPARLVRSGWRRAMAGGYLLPTGMALVGFMLLAVVVGPSLTGWGENEID